MKIIKQNINKVQINIQKERKKVINNQIMTKEKKKTTVRRKKSKKKQINTGKTKYSN